MAISGYDFKNGPFQDVRYLIAQTQELFEAQIIPKGGPDRWQAAVDRVVPHRKWESSLSLFKQNLYPILKEMDIFYVPKQIAPGPCFIFPHVDATGESVRGTMRAMGWDLILNNTVSKYAELGRDFEFKGPSWIGNTDKVIALMMRLRFVILVEGPFDVLACRLLYPELPVMSSGTKSLNDMHFQYLKVLGVRQINFLFDNEPGKKPGERGAGEIAAMGMSKLATALGLIPKIHYCPSKNDPSACLESLQSAIALKSFLSGFFL
jgi:hypothetical protein